LRCPALKDLPIAPEYKNCWPWTEETLQLPETMSDGQRWPKISIITPNYNFGRFLEETVRSVLLQGYPNLEYIIIDGGSNDDSLDIIRKYERWIAYWVSEYDAGHPQALNKGFSYATGDILAWINSDDLYEKGALKIVAETLMRGGYWVTGTTVNFDESGDLDNYFPEIIPNLGYWVEQFLKGSSMRLPQSSTFWTKNVWLNVGQFEESLEYGFDHEFFFRICERFGNQIIINDDLARARFHNDTKSSKAFSRIVSDNLQCGIRNKYILPFLRWIKIPIFILRTKGKIVIYNYLETAERKKGWQAAIYLLKLPLRHPALLFNRMFLSLIYKQIKNIFTSQLRFL